MTGITSRKWLDFLKQVAAARKKLGNPEVLWYRGHHNAEFNLLASLLRFENGLAREEDLFANFRKFSDRIFGRRESEWETLFEMQHYGIPTRLLDWSETFGVALFFAVRYNQSDYPTKDAAIYLLDPLKLSSRIGREDVVRLPDDERGFGYQEIYWKHKPFRATAPIALEPIFFNERMRAQRGVFTVHDDDTRPLEDKFADSIKKVILPNEAISAAKEFLELSSINIFTVFPDLAGIGEFLKNTSKLKRRPLKT